MHRIVAPKCGMKLMPTRAGVRERDSEHGHEHHEGGAGIEVLSTHGGA